MKRVVFLLAALLAGSLAWAAKSEAEIDIPYHSFKLDNGLTVLVHEDHKAPIVAVNLWYHVGSKDEKPGKTGFAHLFEHLMFNGSENWNDEFFAPFEKAGATDMNGTTWLDRTNYFETVPTTALDMALWMESDRMGHLLGAITQERLDEQRGVVQNEKRQGENRPYGKMYETLMKYSFPEGHPYSWTTIGSMEDLNAATLEDVKEWFRKWYGPSNTVLTLAGDIDLETARAKVEQYFGNIPAGEPVQHLKRWVAKRHESTRVQQFDRVPQARIVKSWNIPGYGDPENHALQLVAATLGQGKNSPLYQRLVYQDQIATTASASTMEGEAAGLFILMADVKPGVDPKTVERAMEEVMAAYLKKGPAKQDLERVKTSTVADFLRGAEKVGGFGGKAQILGRNQTYLGRADAWKDWLKNIRTARSKTVRAAARQWLSSGDFTLSILPFPEGKTSGKEVDRSQLPAVSQVPELRFPELQHARLKNGVEVVLAERHAMPLVEISTLFDAGYAADFGQLQGRADFTLSMLDEGTHKRSALEIAAEAERLGANISAGSSLDSSSVSLSALKEKLDESLALYADILQNPAFDEAEIERLRGKWLARIQKEKAQPRTLALRILPPLLYGKDHPYGIILTGSGDEASIQALKREDLLAFHQQWIRPDKATILVAGDITMDELLPRLEKALGGWQPPAVPAGRKPEKTAALPDKPRVFLLDKPGAQQSVILAGRLAPPMNSEHTLPFEVMNDVFGGKFSARLNMNLREDKHWAYGAYSFAISARGQRPWLATAPVQTDKTIEAMQEVLKEVQAMAGERPPTAEEIQKIRDNEIRSLPGKYETTRAVLGALINIRKFGYPDDHVITYQKRLESLADEAVVEQARQFMKPEVLTWVVVGDLSKIEDGIRQLNLGEVHVLDKDGQVIR